MIDVNARNKIQSLQTARVISDGIDKLSDAIKGGKGEGGSMVLANEFRALQKVLSEEALTKLKTLITDLDGKLNALAEVEKNLPRKIEMDFPEVYPVSGSVEISKLPSVNIQNPQDIAKQLSPLLSNLTTSIYKAMQSVRIATPSAMKIKDAVEIQDFQELLNGMEELKKGFNLLINKEIATIGFPDKILPVEIQNWKVPQPVTHVSINGLIGEAVSTAVTVTASLTALPSTALSNRRSLVCYNNSSSTTIFIGGANVTAASGIPVPAGTYSPSMDASARLIIYAVTSTGSADVRVLEMSDEGSGK